MYQDGQYLQHNPSWHEQDSPFKASWIFDLLQKWQVTPNSVGEVGCGAAGILRSLAEKLPSSEFDGWDVSPQAIDLANLKPHPRVKLHLADIIEAQPFYDVLLAIDVLEHMENPALFLRNAKSLCSHIAVHLPLDLAVQTVVRPKALVQRRRELGHIHMFTRETALELLRENGWEIIDERYTPSALQLPIPPDARYQFQNHVLRIPRRISFFFAPHLTTRILGGWSILILAKPVNS
ncbi:MAG: class I SAM-dependent methyltransferase [Fibrobacterota bacterium]|nr:class I SAM-dependent methyltransferase [Fibrobacterota bacterium]QQS06095.1 MAG: class I SAM-dependent methyltransferase [Fibrobacterota bacterium]